MGKVKGQGEKRRKVEQRDIVLEGRIDLTGLPRRLKAARNDSPNTPPHHQLDS
jgi:hypothetical protein